MNDANPNNAVFRELHSAPENYRKRFQQYRPTHRRGLSAPASIGLNRPMLQNLAFFPAVNYFSACELLGDYPKSCRKHKIPCDSGADIGSTILIDGGSPVVLVAAREVTTLDDSRKDGNQCNKPGAGNESGGSSARGDRKGQLPVSETLDNTQLTAAGCSGGTLNHRGGGDFLAMCDASSVLFPVKFKPTPITSFETNPVFLASISPKAVNQGLTTTSSFPTAESKLSIIPTIVISAEPVVLGSNPSMVDSVILATGSGAPTLRGAALAEDLAAGSTPDTHHTLHRTATCTAVPMENPIQEDLLASGCTDLPLEPTTTPPFLDSARAPTSSRQSTNPVSLPLRPILKRRKCHALLHTHARETGRKAPEVCTPQEGFLSVNRHNANECSTTDRVPAGLDPDDDSSEEVPTSSHPREAFHRGGTRHRSIGSDTRIRVGCPFSFHCLDSSSDNSSSTDQETPSMVSLVGSSDSSCESTTAAQPLGICRGRPASVQRLRLLHKLGIITPSGEHRSHRDACYPTLRCKEELTPQQRKLPGFGTTGAPAALHNSDFEMRFTQPKVRDDFRINFLKRLSYRNVWLPAERRPPQHQTVTILDWDDTLLCTTHINLFVKPGRKEVKPAELQRLNKDVAPVEASAKRLVEAALVHGPVFIITNAMSGWVEFSARRYMPSVVSLLDERVTVISARTNYETAYPGQCHLWKVQAFLEVRRQLDNDIVTNLISVGDSPFEMDAVHALSNKFSQALVKTVKLRERPTPDELVKQLQLVTDKLSTIVSEARNINVTLEQKGRTKAAAEATSLHGVSGGLEDSSSSIILPASLPFSQFNSLSDVS